MFNSSLQVSPKSMSLEGLIFKSLISFTPSRQKISETISIPATSLKDKVIGRLRILGLYEDGWFVETSKAASKKTIDDAEKFLRQLNFNQVSPPFIGLAEDGEINFLWKTKNFDFDLGFCGDGTYNYYGKHKIKGEYFGEFPIAELLEPTILDHLSETNDLKTQP